MPILLDRLKKYIVTRAEEIIESNYTAEITGQVKKFLVCFDGGADISAQDLEDIKHLLFEIENDCCDGNYNEALIKCSSLIRTARGGEKR